MKQALLWCSLLAIAAAGILAQQQRPGGQKGGQKKGGPAGTFVTDVPRHLYDIVLARPEDRSITASVLAYEDMDARIVYTGGKTEVTMLTAGVPENIKLENLKPDTAYTYHLEFRKPRTEPFDPSPTYSFHTRRAPGASFTVTIQADSHLDNNTNPEVYKRDLENAAADKPDFEIDLGDTFMTDKYPDYKAAAKQYLAQRYYFGLLCSAAPLFLVLGNHDGEQGRFLNGGDDNMAVWSNMMRKKYFPNPISGGEDPNAGVLQDYYSWEWGDALFIALDPFWNTKRRGGDGGWAWTLGKPQYDWLVTTLAASKAKYKMVFLHHLVGGAESQRGGVEAAKFYEWGGQNADGTEAFAAQRPGWPMPIHEVLKKYKVAAVFHGHDHLYAKQELDGIVYQEVPQPGFNRQGPANSAAEYGYLAGKILGSPGHLRMRISPEGMKVEFTRPVPPEAESATRHNGEVADSYWIK